jgi:hypothetical protein
MSGYCALIVVAAALLLSVAPGSGFDWPVTIGVAVTFAVGELVIRYAESRRIAAGLELAETAAAD